MQIRKCAWQPENQDTGTAVWARASVFTTQCPKSLITAQSMAWLEQFSAWKTFGGGVPWSMPAKSVDALLVLEQAWRMENEREQQ